MIHLIKNENQILLDQFLQNLISKNKILDHNVYQFNFNDELNAFLNLSLTKTFSLEKKLVILRVENLEAGLLKKFKANFRTLLKNKNQIVLVTNNDVFFQEFSSVLSEDAVKHFLKFKPLELRAFIKTIARKNHYKISKAEIDLLIKQQNTDDYFTFLELKKLILLGEEAERTKLLFTYNNNHFQKIFTSFLMQDLSVLKHELNYFIHNDGSLYSLIDFLIKQYLSLIIYLDDKHNFSKKQTDKQWFFVNFYNQNLEALSAYIDLPLALKKHYSLLILKNHLLGMSRITFDYKNLFANKILQLAISR